MGDLQEGQKIKLFIETDDNPAKELESSIKRIYLDRISLNVTDEILEYSDFLEEGEEFPVKIFTPVGIKCFSTIVLNSPPEEEFIIEYIEDASKIQRREYVRVALTAKILVTRENNKEKIVAYTSDISGGGIKFLHQGKFEKNEIISLTLYLPDAPSINTKAIVVDNPHLKENEHVISFVDINEKERERIIKYCFMLQMNTE